MPERLGQRPGLQPGRHRRLERDLAGIARSEGQDDPSHGERDDERVQPEDPDQDAVREPDDQTQAEAGENREPEPLVGVLRDAQDEVAAEEYHGRDREVDAGLHDHEHRAERRDRENRHHRKDERPGRALQRRGSDDRRDDHEGDRGEPDREEAGRKEQGAQCRAQLEPLRSTREPVPSRLGTGRCRRLSHAFARCTAMLNYSPVAPWVTSTVPRGTATLRLVGPRVKWLDQVLSKTPKSPGC